MTNSSTQPITVWWINFEGDTEPYFEIPPGGSEGSDTFRGHTWLITDAKGDCVTAFEAPAR